MQYKYPKEIQIGGHTYKIILKDASTVDDCGHNQGDSCQANLEIRVSTRLTDGTFRVISALEQTIWHEILHQVDRVYAAEKNLEEGDIDRLAQGLFQIVNQLDWHIIRTK